MITAWDIYWITRLDYIGHGLLGVTILSLFASIILIGVRVAEHEEIEKEVNKDVRQTFAWIIGLCLSLFFISITVNIFTPTTKEAVAMYLLPKIVNNEQVQKLPDTTLKLFNAKLEKWLNETAEINTEKGE